MADLIMGNTDDEVEKYEEAYLIASNPPPMDSAKSKTLNFNRRTGKNDVLLPLSSGGYAKVGEEPIPRVDQVKKYARELQGMNAPFDMADYDAAGFTAEEVQAAGIMPVQAPTSGRSEPMTEGETLIAQRQGESILSAYDPTLREDVAASMSEIFQAVGLDSYQARQVAEGLVGNPESTRKDLGLGVADMTPLALIFGGQEGGRTFMEGYNTGNGVNMGLGALEAGLSFLEALPMTAAGAKGLKKQIPAFRAAIADVGREAQKRIDAEGTTMFSNPVGPVVDRGLAAAGRLAETPTTNQPVDQLPVEAPRITPRDLEGARIIPTVADLTRAGGFYTGIDSSLIDIPEVMMGGPGFPLLPSSQENGLAWAVQGKSIGTKKSGKGADLIAVTAMNPTSHKSNISFINSLIKTTDAYVRDGRIGDNVINALDNAIRQAGAGGDQALVGLAKFPGFKSPNAQEFINNASFQERSRIASVIGTKEMQEAGAPNVERVLQATVDPKYAGANPRDTLLFIEPDFSLPPVDLEAEGLPVHPSYRYGIRGRVFGALDQNISTFEMFPTFWGEKNINAFGADFNKGGRRAFDMNLPIQEVTGEQVQNLERIMTMQAAKNTNLSAIDTRLLVNSLTDNWKPTTTSVKAGGASPQAFVDAINNNKYKPALTNYSPQDVKAGARSGDLVAYQLGDDDVFFALDSKPDYSWAGVDMQEGDKALVGVVSNAPGSKGTAAPSVIAKALDEGANILDAFAVPSAKFPDGFLPQYYGEFGFEEVGRVPFDKDMYVAEHGELAYEDLLEAWRSDGWDENMGMPPVIVMRWSGSDADRKATSAGIRGAGAPSHRAETGGFVAEAEGSAGRVADETVQPQSAGVERGDTGEAGAGDGLRLSGRARRGAESILGLTPEQLRNQGIPADQIEQIMAMRKNGN